MYAVFTDVNRSTDVLQADRHEEAEAISLTRSQADTLRTVTLVAARNSVGQALSKLEETKVLCNSCGSQDTSNEAGQEQSPYGPCRAFTHVFTMPC